MRSGRIYTVCEEKMSRKEKARQLAIDQKLYDLFYNVKQPSSFSGRKELTKQAKKLKIKNNDVNKWLLEQDAYTLHRHVRRKYKTN